MSAQLEVRRAHGFARSARASALGAAAPKDFLLAPTAPLIPVPGVREAPDPNRRALFPGALKLALALAGLVWGMRHVETRRFSAFLVALAAAAVALSLLPGPGERQRGCASGSPAWRSCAASGGPRC